MNIKKIILHMTSMKLKTPFQTSYGIYIDRESMIIEMEDSQGIIGFGEVVSFSDPWYTEETLQTSYHIIKDFLAPILLQNKIEHPNQVTKLFSKVKRNHMAKAGLEGAVWDIYGKQQQLPLATAIGGKKNKIPVGVVVGIAEPKVMLGQIASYLEEGYERVKIKISPQNDVKIVQAIRKEFPDVPLMADANGSYTLQEIEQLKRLDEYHLMMIEQPLGERDFMEHAQLQKLISTPICLDESIHSLADVKLAHALGSCQVINIKSGRVGGITEAIGIHDYCMEHHIPVWCGGMLETGIGRAHNIALATLPNFTIPGDISASQKYWEEDIITPEIVLDKGYVHVPAAWGIGVEVNRKRLQEITVRKEVL